MLKGKLTYFSLYIPLIVCYSLSLDAQELLTLQTCAHETKTLTHADAYKEPNEKEQRAAIKEMEQVHQLSIQKLQADYEEKISKVGELERTNAELVRMSAMLHLKKEEIEKELLSYKSAATGSAKASYEALSNDASELAEAVVKSQIALETKSRESKFNMTIDDLREQLRISSEEKDKLLMEISVNKMKTEGVDAFVAQNPVTPPQPGWFAKEHERRKELEEEKSVIIQNIQKENIAELEEKCKELERMNDELLRQHVVHQRVWTELRANPTISDFLGPSVEGDSSDFPPTTTTMHKTSTDRELEQFVAKRVSMYETCISSVDSLLQQVRSASVTSCDISHTPFILYKYTYFSSCGHRNGIQR